MKGTSFEIAGPSVIEERERLIVYEAWPKLPTKVQQSIFARPEPLRLTLSLMCLRPHQAKLTTTAETKPKENKMIMQLSPPLPQTPDRLKNAKATVACVKAKRIPMP